MTTFIITATKTNAKKITTNIILQNKLKMLCFNGYVSNEEEMTVETINDEYSFMRTECRTYPCNMSLIDVLVRNRAELAKEKLGKTISPKKMLHLIDEIKCIKDHKFITKKMIMDKIAEFNLYLCDKDYTRDMLIDVLADLIKIYEYNKKASKKKETPKDPTQVVGYGFFETEIPQPNLNTMKDIMTPEAAAELEKEYDTQFNAKMAATTEESAPETAQTINNVTVINEEDRIFNPALANPVESAPVIAAEPVKENATIDKFNIDYWWKPENVELILNRCIDKAAANKFKKDFIPFNMIRSFVFEMMFGHQLTEWVTPRDKVNIYSRETTPRKWNVNTQFCNRLFKKYMMKYNKGAVIKSSEIIKYHKHVVYSCVDAKTKRMKYFEIDINKGTARLQGSNKTWKLCDAIYNQIDKEGRLYRIIK